MTDDKKVGILQPQISWRFRVRFPGTLSSVEQSHLTCQLESCSIDYAKRQISLVIVQDSITTILHEIFSKICKFEELPARKKNFLVHVDSLDGRDEKPLNVLEFTCTSASHEFKLDYASSDFAKHYLTLDIQKLLLYNNKEMLDVVEARSKPKEEKEENKMT